MKKKYSTVTHSTLGKDTVRWSFSKGQRFGNKVSDNCPELLDLPSTLGQRSTSFGYGKRWQPRNPKGNDAPSPNKYSLPTCFDLEKRGAYFTIDIRDSIWKKNQVPGPGSYDLGTTLCKDGPKFSFRGRIGSKPRPETPSPGAYNPKFTLVEKMSYTTFGACKKSPDERPRSGTPGPGTYEIPSSFTKAALLVTKIYSTTTHSKKNSTTF